MRILHEAAASVAPFRLLCHGLADRQIGRCCQAMPGHGVISHVFALKFVVGQSELPTRAGIKGHQLGDGFAVADHL